MDPKLGGLSTCCSPTGFRSFECARACTQTGNTILRSTGLDEGVQHLRRTQHGSLQLGPSERLYFRWKVKKNVLKTTRPSCLVFEHGDGCIVFPCVPVLHTL